MSKISIDVKRIAAMSRPELVDLWPEFFDVPVPRRVSVDLLRMALAWRFQARESRTSMARIDRQIDRIAGSLNQGRTPRALQKKPHAGRGTILVRTWRDKAYTVTVSDKGFVFEGVTYRSLSEIARKITGTRWNGPSFFGLRSGKPIKQAEAGRGN